MSHRKLLALPKTVINHSQPCKNGQPLVGADGSCLRCGADQGVACPLSVSPSSLPDPGVAATHRHKRRGTEYVLIGYGKVQASKWKTPTIRPDEDGQLRWTHVSIDMHEVAIYRSVDDGSLWVRPREEFEDGRFEVLASLKGGQ